MSDETFGSIAKRLDGDESAGESGVYLDVFLRNCSPEILALIDDIDLLLTVTRGKDAGALIAALKLVRVKRDRLDAKAREVTK